jgi:hypothetical protein
MAVTGRAGGWGAERRGEGGVPTPHAQTHTHTHTRTFPPPPTPHTTHSVNGRQLLQVLLACDVPSLQHLMPMNTWRAVSPDAGTEGRPSPHALPIHIPRPPPPPPSPMQHGRRLHTSLIKHKPPSPGATPHAGRRIRRRYHRGQTGSLKRVQPRHHTPAGSPPAPGWPTRCP